MMIQPSKLFYSFDEKYFSPEFWEASENDFELFENLMKAF